MLETDTFLVEINGKSNDVITLRHIDTITKESMMERIDAIASYMRIYCSPSEISATDPNEFKVYSTSDAIYKIRLKKVRVLPSERFIKP